MLVRRAHTAVPTPADPASAAPGSTPEFCWQPAARPAVGLDRADRLAAATVLARRCVELGVQPPLRPVPANKAPAPAHHLLSPAAPQSSGPAAHAGRLEALVEQAQNASSTLATAVQRQSQQLATQQQLLKDVVQSLLYVSGKAGGGSRPAGAVAAGQARFDSAALVRAAASSRMLTPRHAASAVQQRALQAQLTPSCDTRRKGSCDEVVPWAALGSSLAPAHPRDASAPGSPPFGMLRAPIPAAAAAHESACQGRPSRLELGSSVGTPHPQAAAGVAQPALDAEDRRAAVKALLGLREGSGGGGCSSGRGQGQQRRGRPAWNDSTILQPRADLRDRQEIAAQEPRRRNPGGLGAQLLRQELRHLQRRHTIAGGGGGVAARPARMQQAPRPMTASTAAPGMDGKARAAGTPGKERQSHAKHSVAMGGQRRVTHAAEKGRPLSLPCPIQLQACHRAAAARRAAERHAVAPAESSMSTGQDGKQLLHRHRQEGCASGSSSAELSGGQAPPCDQLTEEDISAVCDSICRQLLLHECSPCACEVPVC